MNWKKFEKRLKYVEEVIESPVKEIIEPQPISTLKHLSSLPINDIKLIFKIEQIPFNSGWNKRELISEYINATQKIIWCNE